jgi:hypothetical protein
MAEYDARRNIGGERPREFDTLARIRRTTGNRICEAPDE